VAYYDSSIEQLPLDRYSSYWTGGPTPGSNGISGFHTWECYMLLKYGKAGDFNPDNDYQYLIELPMYPEQVTESIGATWSTQNVLGRSSPLSAYANTDLKTVNFSLELHRDFLTGSYSLTKDALDAVYERAHKQTGGGYSEWNQSQQAAGRQLQTPEGPFDTRTWYVSANKMLQMSCYPQYTSYGQIPPTTYFIFGQMILKGYVRSYSTTWQKPIINTFYAWNRVDITMECYPDTIMSARDFILNYSSSSTQNTYNTTFPDIGDDQVSKYNVMQRNNMRSRHNYRNDSLGGNVMDIS